MLLIYINNISKRANSYVSLSEDDAKLLGKIGNHWDYRVAEWQTKYFMNRPKDAKQNLMLGNEPFMGIQLRKLYYLYSKMNWWERPGNNDKE